MQVADHASASTVHVAVGQATGRGGREANEDFAACVPLPPQGALTIDATGTAGVVAALADGMGGARGGRVAAELAVRGFLEACLEQAPAAGVARAGAAAAEAVNRWIHALGRSDPDLNGMACTLSALVLCGRSTHVIHVGDSRVYRLRGDTLTQLTTDHTLGAPGTTHALTRAVGAQDSLRADHVKDSAQLHDRYLLCSDGVHGALPRRDIQALLARRASPQETATRLVEQACVGTDSDNATALVLDILALPDARIADLAHASASLPLRAPPARGETVDGHELLEMLADGEYMRVFRARPPGGERDVVLKFPKPRPGLEPLLRAALLRETWIAGHVRSPFVTESLDPAPERRSCLYGVLPFHDGETLERRLLRRPAVPLAAGIAIAIKLTRAVAALHRAGVIHRDIKPDNILLEHDGGLKLIDLGVARLRHVEDMETLELPGTRSYMAPELFTGTPADESTDLYALGVTVYRLFSGGAYPYGEMEPFTTPRFGKVTPLARHRPDLPAWLDHCVARAVAVDRRHRPADAIEFGFELEHGALRAVPQAIGFVPLLERDPVRFWQAVSALLLLALLVTLAMLA